MGRRREKAVGEGEGGEEWGGEGRKQWEREEREREEREREERERERERVGRKGGKRVTSTMGNIILVLQSMV